jgi:PAS domain S-box-containing protein
VKPTRFTKPPNARKRQPFAADASPSAGTAASSFSCGTSASLEEFYRQLVEQSPEAMLVHRQGVILFANGTCREFFGASSTGDLLGRQVLDFVHPADRSAVKERIEAARPDPARVRRNETNFIRFDGKPVCVEVLCRSVDYQGAPALQVTFRDISQRKEIERRLRQSEASLAAAQRTAHVGSFEYDLHNLDDLCANPLRWSDEVFRIFGYEPGAIEISRESFLRAVHPDDRDRIEKTLEQALPERKPITTSYRILLPNGAERIVQGHSHFVFDSRTGRPLQLVGIIQDITEQRRAEEEARRLAAIVETTNDSIIGATPEGVITDWNGAAECMYGYAAAEVLGKSVSILAPADRKNEGIDILQRVAAGERIIGLETRRVRKDGAECDVSITISPIHDAAGRLVGSSGISRDITERKRMEAALQRSEADFRSFVENSPYGVIRATSSGRILLVNRALVRLLGYGSESEVLRLNMTTDVYNDPADRARAMAQAERYNGAPWAVEVEWKRKNGSPVAVRFGGRAVRGSDGSVEYYEALIEDVTERRALESQLLQAQRMEAVGRLAGGVAHDFNNLLGVIIGHSELLLDQLGENPPLRKHLHEIKRAGERAASLTRQLLAFSRQQVMETRVVDLNSVVADMSSMLNHLIGKDVELHTMLDPKLGTVKADPGQIERVIMNLAVNARDAMPGGGQLIVETRNAEVDELYAGCHSPMRAGPYVLLTVTDTGVGMDRLAQAHIFEPFYTTKAPGKGTGLGLSTVYGVVKQSGGFIWVYSEPGVGTTFKIYLPRVEQAPRSGLPAGVPVRPAHESKTILLVEDEESLRILTRTFLVHGGYAVLEAGEGRAALELARRHDGPIHLLLTDMVLPDINGRAVMDGVVAAHPGVKVLFMSGYSGFMQRGLLEPGAHLLAKPFTRDVLMRKLNEVFAAEMDAVPAKPSSR